MDELAAYMAGGRPGPTGQPFDPRYPPGVPGWRLAPPPSNMPPPPFPGQPGPGYGGAPVSTTRSLFESIGNLIRLGVDALNAGLAGGMQIVEGYHGPGPYDSGPYGHGFPYHHPGWGGYGYPGYYDCCGDPYCGYYGCNPSVHNCS